MKTKHQQSAVSLSNPLSTVFFAVTVLLSLASAPAYANYVVVVQAYPLWTDTGINLANEEIVTITATGSWVHALYIDWYGPDGQVVGIGPDQFLALANKGSLIAFVGSDPYQGHWGDGSFFPQTSGYWNIGSSSQFTSDKTGELWLGFNDDAVSEETFDNTGSVTAQISVVPEPATLLLLGLGGLAAMRRRRV